MVSILFSVPFSLPEVRVMCGALTVCNRIFIKAARRAGHKVPLLYKAGVRYERDDPGTQRFLTIGQVLEQKNADCKSLAAWRAAELQEAGIMAIATPRRITKDLIHVIVKYPDGHIEDPSKKLGMGKGERG